MSILSVQDISKRYKFREVVKGISLEITSGEVVGLLGPNGAGKTTAFYMIVGLITSDRGRILLDGQDLTALPMHKRAALGVGYLPQEASIFRKLTVEQNILAILENRPELDRAGREQELDQLLEDKIGRRGNLNVRLTVFGTQGHTAYAHLADNPAHRLVRMLGALIAEPLDAGNAHFEPSTLQVTSIDIGNSTSNVIPAEATAAFNVRYNTEHSQEMLEAWLRHRLEPEGARYHMSVDQSAPAFLTEAGSWTDVVAKAAAGVTGAQPQLGTDGGTSDARFIKDVCPVAELGLRNATAHKIDEQTELSDLTSLTDIYRAVLEGYFPQ